MDANENIVARLKQWMEDDGMSSPTEYGANTPMYIYRIWGGEVPLKEIEKALGGDETITKDIAERNLRRCLRSGGGNKR